MCDSIANGGPRYYAAAQSSSCPPANVIIASNILSTNGNVIAGNVISQDGTFTGNLYVTGQIYANINFNTINVGGVVNAQTIVASSYLGDGAGLSNLNASNLNGTVSLTNLPLSGVTAGIYGDYSNVSRVTLDSYGRVTNASNVPILSSQWTTVAGNVAYSNGVSIGTLAAPPPGSNLLVRGTANIDTLNVSTLFANSAVIFGAKTLNVYGISNLFFISGDGGGISNVNAVAAANANVALVVSQPEQPNITSVSDLGKTFTVNGLLVASNGSGISNLNSSNLVGNVANANVALVVSQPAQPNITSLGTLTGLNVQGLLIASNGSGLSNLNASNLVGNVANANVALVVSQPAQPNITSVSDLGKTFTVNGLLIASNGSGISNLNASNLVGNVANANVAMVVSQPAQPNITSLGTLTGLNVQGLLIASNGSGLSNLNASNLVGNVANANVALVVSQPAQPNITSVGKVGSLFTINGLLIASNGSGLSNLNASNLVGNVANANVALVVSQPAQPNITSVGKVGSLFTINGLLIASNGSGLSNLNASNLVGNVANANVALVVSQALQPNITGLGTLTGLFSSGNISASFFVGGGNALSNVQSSVLVGNVASANVALVVSQPFQPNITSVGALTSLTVIGSLTAGTLAGDGFGIYGIKASAITETVATANSVVQPAQPNITSLGTLTGLNVQGLLVVSNGSGISNINASNVTLGTLATSVLPASGVTAGLYGSGANVSSITVDTRGRVTAASNVQITSSQWVGSVGNPIYYQNFVGIGAATVPSATLQVTGNVYASNSITTPNIFFNNQISATNLPASGVVAGGYGSSVNVASLAVDTYGRVTNASNIAFISSQWTTVAGNVAFTNGVSIGTLGAPPVGSNLYVLGTATISNVISNGSALSALQSSNLVGNVANANVALVVSQPVQPNITSLGTLTGLNVQGLLIASNGSGISNLNASNLVGNVANANVALVVSQPAQPNITSLGTLSGLNVQGLLIASNGSGISNLNSSNLVGNVANANVAMVVSQPAQPNITSLGTLTGLNVQGLLIASNGSGISNLNSSNLVGNVANANVALVVSQPAQPNITSLGTLTGLYSTGNIQASFFTGGGNALANIQSSVLVGNVASSNVALVVSQPAQPNITSLGTLTGLYSTGNIQASFFAGGGNALANIQSSVLVGNVASSNVALVVIQPAQPNITSVGNGGTTFTVNGLLIASNGSGISNLNASNLVGNVANANVALVVSQALQPNITGLGTLTGLNVNGLLIASNGSGISNLNASNLVGNVANANVALVVSQPAQPNITSVGLLSNLAVSNSVTVANLVATFTSNLANANVNDLTVPGSMRANLTNTTFFFNTLTIPFVNSTTLNVSSTSNLDTLTLTGEPGLTTLYAVGNIFSTNSFSTVNVFASSNIFARNVFASNGLDVGPGTLGTNVVVFSNISGGANTFVMDSNGRVGIGTTSPQSIFHVQVGSVTPATGSMTTGVVVSAGPFGTTAQAINMGASGSGAGHAWIQSAYVNNPRIGNTLAINPLGGGVGIGTTGPSANLHVQGNIFSSNSLQTNNVLTSNINVTYTANISKLVVTSNILAGPAGNTYLTGNLVVSGNVFTSLGTPLGEGGSLYYSLASNYKPPVYTGVLYGQALALSLGPFNEQGSSSLVSRSANGNFKFNKPGVYNIKAVFLTTQDNVIGIGVGSNVSDTTTRTDQTYVYRYTTFVTQNPTEILDIQFYVGSTTAYYYVDLFAVDAPTLMPTADPLGGSWMSIGPFQGGGGSGPPVTISTLGAVVTGRTTSYGAGSADYYIGMANGQTVNLPLGSSLTAGKQFIIKDESGLAGTFVGYRVTIAASSPDLIDGQTSVILGLNYGAINVIWTGSFWSIY